MQSLSLTPLTSGERSIHINHVFLHFVTPDIIFWEIFERPRDNNVDQWQVLQVKTQSDLKLRCPYEDRLDRNY